MQLGAQERDGRRRQVGRPVGVDGGIEKVAEHDEVTLVRDGRRKWRQVACADRIKRLVDSGQRCPRADRRVAVARKVLGGGQHAGGVDAVDHVAYARRDLVRHGAVAAAPHDRGWT